MSHWPFTDLVEMISGKRAMRVALGEMDYATDASLSELATELANMKAELAEVKENQLSGGQKVQLAETDFATEATLAALATELDSVKIELTEVKANQISGDQKVQLTGSLVVSEEILDIAVAAGSTWVSETFVARGSVVTMGFRASPSVKCLLGMVGYSNTYPTSNAIANYTIKDLSSTATALYAASAEIITPRYALKFENKDTVDVTLKVVVRIEKG